MTEILARPTFLILLCAVGYASATLAMKVYSSTAAMPALMILILCLGVAVAGEVILMRHMTVALIYVLILGAETMLVLAASSVIGQGLTPKEWFGGLLIVGGALMALD